MAGRRTNLALLWCTVLAVVTGVGAFLVGTPNGAWIVVAHGVVALGVVILAPWKTMIASRGMERQRSGRAFSLLLTMAIVGVLVSGFALITGVRFVGPLTTMQVHVGLGLGAIVGTLVHLGQRPTPHRRADLDRRNLLRTGGLMAGAGALWLLIESTLDLAHLPGGARRFTGSHEITDPNAIPATQWINDRVQHLERTSHVVRIAERTLKTSDLDGTDEIEATLDCTGGWFTTQTWSGTRLDQLLDVTTGHSVVVRSTTGYWRRFPIEHASRLLLATRLAGELLPDGNGGPVRLVAPGRRGYWWVKWVEAVEVDDRPPWWQPPLPVA
ncbi:MAG TPA: molybdopterin-dependent oxidoreductase [Acidimicrobiia bacterium]